MSLLMDALKKAELAKRQGQAESADALLEPEIRSGLALEPMPDAGVTDSTPPAPDNAGVSNPANLPHLPSHLEDLDAKFLAEAKQAADMRLKSPPAAPGREPLTDPATEAAARAVAPGRGRTGAAPPGAANNHQSTARNLFSAKQAEKPATRKTFAIAVGVLTVVAVCGIGGYFWWQLQPKSSLVASRTPMTPPPVAAKPATAPAAVSPAPSFPAATTQAASPSTSPASPPAAPLADDTDDDAPKIAARTRAQPRRAAPAEAPTEGEGPVRVTRAPLKVNPALLRGFDAFNRGDLAVAQREYEQALKSDPRNTDTLHGLAAIAVRHNRPDHAEALYRRIVEADPHDTVAMSALINMRGQIDPNAAESRLKTLAADQPELAAPHFALGNLYARHGRWSEAQQAYFRAYNAEPDNPDIIYNLAISLEHLRQNKLAAQYYGQAIAAAQTRTAGFDKAQVAARLQTLRP